MSPGEPGLVDDSPGDAGLSRNEKLEVDEE